MVQDSTQPVIWKVFLHGVIQADIQRFVFSIDGTGYEPHEKGQVAMVFGRLVLSESSLLHMFGKANNVRWDFATEMMGGKSMLGVLFIFDAGKQDTFSEIHNWLEHYHAGMIQTPYLFVALIGPDSLSSSQLRHLLPFFDDELVMCNPDYPESCKQIVMDMWKEHRVKSPKILSFSWGRLDIEGYDHEFKDAKLYPGGARDWDWRETGTRHIPGIQPADVHELLQEGAEVVVLSKGVQEQLQTCPETLELLNERSIETHVLQTEQAIEKYNQLVDEGRRAGALIHSTC